MSDLFARLARRSLGLAPGVRPVPRPLFAPRPVDAPTGEAPEPVTAPAASPAPPERSNRPAAPGPAPAERPAPPPGSTASSASAGRPGRRTVATLGAEPASARRERMPPALRPAGETEETPGSPAARNLGRPRPRPRIWPVESGTWRSQGAAEPELAPAPAGDRASAPRLPRGEAPAVAPRRSLTARERRARAPVSLERPPAAPPTIQVTIGRVEVRNPAPPPEPARRAPREPTLSLDDYLARRQGGRG